MKLIRDIFFLGLEPPSDGAEWVSLISLWVLVLLLVVYLIGVSYAIFSSFRSSSKGENWEEKEKLKELLLKYGNKYHDNLISVLLFSQDKEISNVRTSMIMDGNLDEAIRQILNEIHHDNNNGDNGSDNLVAIQSMNTTISNMNSMPLI
ncbi:hypothetical protein HHK02_01145 [Limosilactobacillus reuteri]|uniref:Uncharacterized protein n=1 Tax=Limosilactobacillus reuteri TaxID=1598 RepID=A0A7L6BJD3_LIMRT|nr:hypothetical protein [Limosilactobacillus reuteri]QLQ61970.1 hypothetical protein HHK02_01145 [Limosilactobacillus reuteri]